MPEQILDAVAERRRGARATGASTAHMQIDDTVAEALEGDVTAILRHGRTHAGFEQLLDGGDNLGVLRGEGFGFALRGANRLLALGHLLTGDVMLHDGAEHGRLQMLPLTVALGHADEVRAEKNAGNAVDLEQREASGEVLASPGSRNSNVPWSSTWRPGINFSVAGLGVASVWMNIGAFLVQ